MSVQGKTLLQNSPLSVHEGNRYPPSLWIGMEKDTRTLRNMQRTARYLTQHHVTAEVLMATALPLTESYFSDRIRGLSYDTSRGIVRALHSCSLVDDTGFLLHDPRVTKWRDCLGLYPWVVHNISKDSGHGNDLYTLADSLKADESPVSEELNVAYAMHELTANYMPDMINFVMKYK